MATVEAVLATALPADVLVLNPPRQGVAEAVTSLLATAPASVRPRAIVYVSCDPATLARDVARLPGWQIASLDAFDMFPQTAHVETVCELVPRTRGRRVSGQVGDADAEQPRSQAASDSASRCAVGATPIPSRWAGVSIVVTLTGTGVLSGGHGGIGGGARGPGLADPVAPVG